MAARRTIGPGGTITIGRRKVDASGRTAEILEVLGEGQHRRYRVRWEDGHESILAPGEDASIQPAPSKPKRR
jgi:hypothetical protein